MSVWHCFIGNWKNINPSNYQWSRSHRHEIGDPVGWSIRLSISATDGSNFNSSNEWFRLIRTWIRSELFASKWMTATALIVQAALQALQYEFPNSACGQYCTNCTRYSCNTFVVNSTHFPQSFMRSFISNLLLLSWPDYFIEHVWMCITALVIKSIKTAFVSALALHSRTRKF